jgi:Ca2+-transporting ATPase
LLNQFKDVMIFILLIVAGISLAVGNFKDAIVILIIVVLNAIIGFVQKFRAEKAMDELKKMAAFNAIIRRGGTIVQVAASELEPGDIKILEVEV